MYRDAVRHYLVSIVRVTTVVTLFVVSSLSAVPTVTHFTVAFVSNTIGHNTELVQVNDKLSMPKLNASLGIQQNTTVIYVSPPLYGA